MMMMMMMMMMRVHLRNAIADGDHGLIPDDRVIESVSVDRGGACRTNDYLLRPFYL